MKTINWVRVVLGGLAAGVIINIFEYGVHRVLLDHAWTAAFRALGKTPTGWATFIPANFFVGILVVWLYARYTARDRRPHCGWEWPHGWSSGRFR